HEFKVYLSNQPGELARVTEALASRAVNIMAIASEGGSDRPFIRVVTNDVTTTEKALKTAGFDFDHNGILSVELLDRPGELAKMSKRLARAQVNVESIYIIGKGGGKTELAVVVDNDKKAKKALK
ncbi:MAG: ACT domain-containing protein, partial [Thermoplasmata archaeon]|nr:ACT domain-containing protein [Thermoplasmata archaeon]